MECREAALFTPSFIPLPPQGERLRMENYSYLTESVRPLAGVAPSLAPFLAQAEARQVRIGVRGRSYKLIDHMGYRHMEGQMGGTARNQTMYDPGPAMEGFSALPTVGL